MERAEPATLLTSFVPRAEIRARTTPPLLVLDNAPQGRTKLSRAAAGFALLQWMGTARCHSCLWLSCVTSPTPAPTLLPCDNGCFYRHASWPRWVLSSSQKPHASTDRWPAPHAALNKSKKPKRWEEITVACPPARGAGPSSPGLAAVPHRGRYLSAFQRPLARSLRASPSPSPQRGTAPAGGKTAVGAARGRPLEGRGGAGSGARCPGDAARVSREPPALASRRPVWAGRKRPPCLQPAGAGTREERRRLTGPGGGGSGGTGERRPGPPPRPCARSPRRPWKWWRGPSTWWVRGRGGRERGAERSVLSARLGSRAAASARGGKRVTPLPSYRRVTGRRSTAWAVSRALFPSPPFFPPAPVQGLCQALPRWHRALAWLEGSGAERLSGTWGGFWGKTGWGWARLASPQSGPVAERRGKRWPGRAALPHCCGGAAAAAAAGPRLRAREQLGVGTAQGCV